MFSSPPRPITAFVNPLTPVRDSHPLPNDVWDRVREERRAAFRDIHRAEARAEDLWDAYEYAQDHPTYPEERGSYDHVTEADFNTAKHLPEENELERTRCRAKIDARQLEIQQIEAAHPEMTSEMWRQMDSAGALTVPRHTNFAIEGIASAFSSSPTFTGSL